MQLCQLAAQPPRPARIDVQMPQSTDRARSIDRHPVGSLAPRQCLEYLKDGFSHHAAAAATLSSSTSVAWGCCSVDSCGRAGRWGLEKPSCRERPSGALHASCAQSGATTSMSTAAQDLPGGGQLPALGALDFTALGTTGRRRYVP
eukprot:scaffold1286_cov109-Isochrysis_galbana.AAC.1